LSNEQSQTTSSGRTRYNYRGTYELNNGTVDCRIMTYRSLSSFIDKGVVDDTDGSNKEVFLLANRIIINLRHMGNWGQERYVTFEITPLSQESLPFMLQSER